MKSHMATLLDSSLLPAIACADPTPPSSGVGVFTATANGAYIASDGDLKASDIVQMTDSGVFSASGVVTSTSAQND